MLFWFFACQPDLSKDTSPSSTSEESASIDYGTDPKRYVLTTLLYLNKRGRLFIYDRERNQEVWTLENPNEPVWQDAHMSVDGTQIIRNECDVVDHDFSKSYLVGLDLTGTEKQRIPAVGSHHSLDIVDENSLVTIEYDVRNTEPYGQVAGDSIVLYNNGEREQLLSTFDVLSPSPVTEMWEHGFFPDAHDWTHANAIRWYPQHGVFLWTIPGINAIWSVDMEGRLQQAFLGRFTTRDIYEQGPMYSSSSYDIIEGGSFDMPHGATLDDFGRLWVLSNGLGNDTESVAQGYEVIDGQLQLIREIAVPIEGARSAGLGSVEYLEHSETVLINWGILGVLEEIDREDRPVWQIETSLGEVLGMSTTFELFLP